MIFEEIYNNHLEFDEDIIVDHDTNKITLFIESNKYDLELDYKWLERMCYKYFGENNYINVSIVNKNRLNLYDKHRHRHYGLDVK